MSREVFQQIAAPDAFLAAHPDEMGRVCWEAGPELSRDTVYLASEDA